MKLVFQKTVSYAACYFNPRWKSIILKSFFCLKLFGSLTRAGARGRDRVKVDFPIYAIKELKNMLKKRREREREREEMAKARKLNLWTVNLLCINTQKAFSLYLRCPEVPWLFLPTTTKWFRLPTNWTKRFCVHSETSMYQLVKPLISLGHLQQVKFDQQQRIGQNWYEIL